MSHSWLQQHQLLDGRGLTGLMAQAQLQQVTTCARDQASLC
jgi:hypothetical protein